MKTKERLYGKIMVALSNEYEHTITYYILDSDTKIDGKAERVYGLKAEETEKDNGEPQIKSILDISPSCEEIERLAKKMLLGFVTLPFFEEIIEDYAADWSIQ